MLFLINGALFLVPHFLRVKLRLDGEVSTREVIMIMTRPLRNMIGPFVRIKQNDSAPIEEESSDG